MIGRVIWETQFCSSALHGSPGHCQENPLVSYLVVAWASKQKGNGVSELNENCVFVGVCLWVLAHVCMGCTRKTTEHVVSKRKPRKLERVCFPKFSHCFEDKPTHFLFTLQHWLMGWGGKGCAWSLLSQSYWFCDGSLGCSASLTSLFSAWTLSMKSKVDGMVAAEC